MIRGFKNICMATDIPFWMGSTGAEQRMLALAEFLSRPPLNLIVFYLGQVTAADLERIERLPCEIVFFESERPPQAFLQRLRWYADATRHQLEKWLRKSGSTRTDSPPPQPLKLADYRWPWAIEQFRSLVAREKPVAILCQYVTMGYLVEALGPIERKQITCILDTHDILHDRGLQFNSAGYLHWLDISQQEEVDVWNKFDAVIAIQPQEAELIRAQVTKPRVLVVGHALKQPRQFPPAQPRPEGSPLTLGYIGSANYSNWHAVNRFLIEVWPDLMQLPDVSVQLLIAGKICEWFQLVDEGRQDGLLMTHVKLLGTVSRLEDFYSQIDLAINPVQFGTGLKIKNVEALAYGRPLVTTASGATGMSKRALDACRISAGLAEMSRDLVELCSHPEQLQSLASIAGQVAKTEFSEEQTFSELRELLMNLD